MSRGKAAILLLTMLILNLDGVACGTGPSQSPPVEKRPAENQNPAQEDAKETAFETPETMMEETANEEKTMQ